MRGATLPRWRDRLVLAAVAGVTAGLVVGWANASWATAGLTTLVVVPLVLAAAWLAGTIPPPAPEPRPRAGTDPHRPVQ